MVRTCRRFATGNGQVDFETFAAAIGQDGRETGETCPLQLAAFSRRASEQQAVRGDSAADRSPHDPNRVEPPAVVTMGFEDLRERRVGTEGPLGDKIVFGGT